MPRLALVSSCFLVAVAACGHPADESAVAESHVQGPARGPKELASDSQIVPYLTLPQARARQSAFEARHPGWTVSRVGELSGALIAEDEGSTTGPVQPALTDDEYVERARVFLVANADLQPGAYRASELAKRALPWVANLPTATVYPDWQGGHDVVFWAPTHPPGFESVESLTGSLAYLVHFREDNVIVGIGTESGTLDTRGLPAEVALTLAKPGLVSSDPTVLAEVIGRTLPRAGSWVPVRDVAAGDIAAVRASVQKTRVADGVKLTVAYDVEVQAEYMSMSDPTQREHFELHFIVDAANGDLLAENNDGVMPVLESNMIDVP